MLDLSLVLHCYRSSVHLSNGAAFREGFIQLNGLLVLHHLLVFYRSVISINGDRFWGARF